ncbi:methylmalonyl-CoA epimerase [Microlunatus soli]|uniref:Methylmalonyl-CoA epimerase n=1 Tax=Microlunatus soli TaxID=630515 RepID=A0A1H1ZXG9_9ACTN|nr:methylmalonyl-CoA epimerase [Microlunatus soli]SDT38289.1 methylmalonyl-CoA epimerase [Microlunatus soli]
MGSATSEAVPSALRAAAVDHVGIATADLDATVAFYRDMFGLVEVHRETNLQQQVIEVMLGPAAEHAATERPTQLQVLAPLSDDSAIARFLDRSGPGLQQLALRVADVEATSSELRGRGLRLLYPEARVGTAGSMINFVHPKDAGGVLLELVQPAEPVVQDRGRDCDS